MTAQALNTALLMGVGDFIAQYFLEAKRSWKQYEVLRTARFFAVGFFVLGPSMHIWYTSLDKIVKTASSMKAAASKMLLDQSLFLPPYIIVFIVIMSVLRLEDRTEIKSKVERDFKPILTTSYRLWPAVQMLNFYYVPLQHRIMVMNVVGLMWNTYIAWKAEHKVSESKVPRGEVCGDTKCRILQDGLHIERLHLFDRYMEQGFLF